MIQTNGVYEVDGEKNEEMVKKGRKNEKPLDPSMLRPTIVIEDHFSSSGLYDSVARFYTEFQVNSSKNVKIYSLGIPKFYEKVVGNKDYFSDKYVYSPEKISNYIASILKNI